MNRPIEIKTPGVHHIAIRVSDMARSKAFYIDKLGFKAVLDQPELLIFFAGQTAIAIKGPEGKVPGSDQFNPFRVGLDHIALACEDRSELERVAKALADNAIENTGIKLDGTLQKDYVAFKDPDRISWEFYSV
ncbi:MAG: VOC family protein [Lewinellaceae bacterium]|nr:VOC family protein [Lewinellaceae bacterium]